MFLDVCLGNGNCCCENLVGELIGLIMCMIIENLVGDVKNGDMMLEECP